MGKKVIKIRLVTVLMMLFLITIIIIAAVLEKNITNKKNDEKNVADCNIFLYHSIILTLSKINYTK